MKRITMMLSVAALMVTLLVASALPAGANDAEFASDGEAPTECIQFPCEQETGPPQPEISYPPEPSNGEPPIVCVRFPCPGGPDGESA